MPPRLLRPTRPFLALLLVVVSAGLLALSLHCRRGGEQDQATLAALAQKRGALRERLLQAEDRAAYDRRAQARLEAKLASLQANPGLGAKEGPAAGAGPQPASSLHHRLVTDPDLFALYRRAVRAGLSVRLGAQYRALGLSPGQIEKFEELYTAENASLEELRATAEDQGLEMSDPDIVAVRQQENRDYLKAVTAATGLSEAAIATIEQGAFSDRLEPLRGLVNQIERYAAVSDSAPITFEQQGRLIEILAGASADYREGRQATPPTIDWNAVVAQAGEFMSAPQLAAVRTEMQMAHVQGLVAQFYGQRPPQP